jgi:hypothetical protein
MTRSSRSRLCTLALLASFGATTLGAQSSEPPVQTLTGGARTVQVVGGVDARATRLLGETTVLTGGRIGMLVNRSTLVAFSARANLNQNLSTGFALPDGREAGLSFGYGGIELGRVLAPTRTLHVTTSVLLGGGATSYHNRRWRSGDDESLPVDGFWLAEPELQLETNVTSALRIGIGGSYRFVHGARLHGVADRDFRGASGAVTLTFGRF